MRNIAALLGIAFMTVAAPAFAAEDLAKQVVGSWKLKSYTLRVVGEDVSEPFGPGAKGSLVLTAGGRWIILVSGGDRKPATNNDERAALLNTLLAYTGRYVIEGDKATTQVDASWNEIYTGALREQVRFLKLDGDTLVVRTPEIASAVRPGKRVVGTLTWERER